MRRRSASLISFSFACHRLRIVCLSTINFPLRVLPQLWVNPRKLKVFRLSLSSPAPLLLRISPKLNQARLLRMNFQSKSAQPLPTLAQKPLCLFPSLEPNDEVVSKPYHNHIPARFDLSPLLDPQVERIVQVDVSQERTDPSPLNRPYLSLHSLAIFQYSGPEPLTISTAWAPRSGHRFRGGVSISRLNTWPARTPVNASPAPLQTPMHDSEPVWVASPSPYETFIHNPLPVFTGAPKSETALLGTF
jgi:hypothetical protein